VEYWNNGILGFGEMGYWDNDKIHLESEVDELVSFLLFFQHSNIPTFHYPMYEAKLRPR
jgi:hypothetical protein